MKQIEQDVKCPFDEGSAYNIRMFDGSDVDVYVLTIVGRFLVVKPRKSVPGTEIYININYIVAGTKIPKIKGE